MHVDQSVCLSNLQTDLDLHFLRPLELTRHLDLLALCNRLHYPECKHTYIFYANYEDAISLKATVSSKQYSLYCIKGVQFIKCIQLDMLFSSLFSASVAGSVGHVIKRWWSPSGRLEWKNARSVHLIDLLQ